MMLRSFFEWSASRLFGDTQRQIQSRRALIMFGPCRYTDSKGNPICLCSAGTYTVGQDPDQSVCRECSHSLNEHEDYRWYTLKFDSCMTSDA